MPTASEPFQLKHPKIQRTNLYEFSTTLNST